jgi:hypothetical protein
MADTKISAATDIVTLNATDMVPVARSGDTSAYHATMAEVATFANKAATVVTSWNTRAGAVTLTSADVNTALGYTAYNATNPSGYQTAAQVTTSLGAYLPLVGGTLTGALDLAADPTVALGAATKQYVDAHTPAGGASITVSDTAPASPASGALWWDSVGGQLYLWYTDPNSSQWVATSSQAVGTAGGGGVTSWNTRTGAVVLSSADVTGALTFTPYNATNPSGYQTASQVTTAVAPALNNAGRNRLHNGGFRINQRTYVSGTALAAAAYGFDRWKAGAGGCTLTFTATPPTTTITITAGTLQQIVETLDVEGGAYTLSWTGTAQGRVNAGTYGASPVTVTGLAANTAITVEFNAGTLGQVQLESGSVATVFERVGHGDDLRHCQRFYQTGSLFFAANSGAGQQAYAGVSFPVTMRGTPTVTTNYTTQTNCSGSTVLGAATTPFGLAPFTVVTATGSFEIRGTFTASADL